MVDGADKINNINSNIYVNPQDATRVSVDTQKEPVPLVEKKEEYKFPFTIEKEEYPIEFEIPKDAPQNAHDFITALISNKKDLMQELGIDSDTYNMLAHTAIGIAYAETKFGCTQNRIYKAFREFYIRYERFVKSSATKLNNYSRGMTNLKYTLHANDESQPEIKNQFIKFGIVDEYELEKPAQSAIATIILLSNMDKKIDRKFLEGFEKSKEKYGISRSDALCALWLGSTPKILALKNGELSTAEWEYINNVHSAMEEYKLKTK